MNFFQIKNYDPGFVTDNDIIKLEKDLDLNGYSLKNFQPRIVITGEWKSDENVTGNRTFVKFGSNIRVMAPFPCLLEGISTLIIEQKGASRTYERIGFNFTLPSGLQSDFPFTSVRNADGLKYQYAEPRYLDERKQINPGDYFGVYLSQHDHRDRGLSNTKRVLVSLILIDDFSFKK